MRKDPSMEGAIRKVIDQYLESWQPANVPVSTGQALITIRAALPDCSLSDDDLMKLVAATAIRKGRNVAFDNSGASKAS
ncbi:hypothetical protein ACFQU1_02800 [Chelatococcus sp. GCM10030263]|jgi:hypothetical protein|uniref:hypothetical protein n=1 Tax=Chelatococcus sp. GCM10030263 TaxID=3273387 RepID=UPI003623D925